MKIGIIQPNFIPWRGYFDFIRDLDHFVLLDDVQYTRADWRNRNRLRTASGGSAWLTVPVLHKTGQIIRDVQIDNSQRWRDKHLSTFAHTYGKSPGFRLAVDLLEDAYAHHFTHLWELDLHLIREIASALGISTPISLSSDLKTENGKNERLISITRHLGGTHYLSGPKARAYLKEEAWIRAGIQLEFKTYSEYPLYPQISEPFDPFVSILDLLAMTGPEAAHHIWER